MKLLIKNVKMAGWIMNEVKSELTPSQDFIFIGIRFCSRVGLMVPPPDRIVKILSRVRQLSALMFCQAREFLCLIGLLNSSTNQIPHGRLYLRPLQLLLLSRWSPHQDPLERKIPHLNQGVLLQPPLPKLSMFTDASNFGWGAHVNYEVDLATKGTWSQEEAKMPINILELKAVLLGVKHFQNRLMNQRVYTHSPVLCRISSFTVARI
jgi:hypothetical protein